VLIKISDPNISKRKLLQESKKKISELKHLSS